MIVHDIKKLREQHQGKGVSRAHLARQLGVNRSFITKLEQGKVRAGPEMMFRIAAYFGRRVDDVFHYEGTVKGGGNAITFTPNGA